MMTYAHESNPSTSPQYYQSPSFGHDFSHHKPARLKRITLSITLTITAIAASIIYYKTHEVHTIYSDFNCKKINPQSFTQAGLPPLTWGGSWNADNCQFCPPNPVYDKYEKCDPNPHVLGYGINLNKMAKSMTEWKNNIHMWWCVGSGYSCITQETSINNHPTIVINETSYDNYQRLNGKPYLTILYITPDPNHGIEFQLLVESKTTFYTKELEKLVQIVIP